MHKAVLFNSLGFKEENWEILKNALYLHLETSMDIEITETQFGKKFVVTNEILGINNLSAKIKSVWFIENEKKYLNL